MARIPISQIPNAPQAGAPVLAPTLPGISALQPINVGAGFDTSGISRTQGLLDSASNSISRSNSDVAQATANTKKNLIDPRPFVAAAGAGQFVGEALQHAGNVAINFADKMLQAKDTMDRVRVDSILNDAVAIHQQEILENHVSPNEWVPTWIEKQGSVNERIESLKISPRIKGAVTADVSRFWGDQANRFALSSTTQSLKDAKEELKVGMEKNWKAGKWDIAEKMRQDGVDTGIISHAEGEEIAMQQESQMQDEWVNTAINADPKNVMDLTGEAMRTNTKVPGMEFLSPGQISQVNAKARSGFHQILNDSSDEADQHISNNDWTDKSQVEDFAIAYDWPDSLKQSHIKALEFKESQGPKAQAGYLQKQYQILSDIRTNYNPVGDKDLTQKLDYKNRIREELPPGMREDLLSEVDRLAADASKPSAQTKAGITKIAVELNRQRLLNVAGFDSDGKITNAEAAKRSMVAQTELLTEIDDWFEKDPALTTEDAYKKLQSVIGPKVTTQAADQAVKATMGGSSGWFPGGVLFRSIGNAFSTTPPTREDAAKKLPNMSGMFNGSGKSPTPAPTGKPTSSLDDNTINFIKAVEGFTPDRFNDYAQDSIGYGTRAKPGEKSITKAEADARLKSELASHAVRVDKALAQNPSIKLNANQRAALISFDFNTGQGDRLISTSDSIEEIAARLPTWNKVTEGGKKVVSKGLVNRRAAELELFTA